MTGESKDCEGSLPVNDGPWGWLPVVRRVLAKHRVRTAEVEDMVQETVVRILNLASERGQVTEASAVTVAKFVRAEFRRGCQRRRQRTVDVDAEDAPVAAPDPARAVELTDFVTWLCNACGGSSGLRWRLLWSTAVMRRSLAEAAREAQITRHRARSEFRKLSSFFARVRAEHHYPIVRRARHDQRGESALPQDNSTAENP